MNSIEQKIKDYQDILLVLRKSLGLSAKELGELVGVRRQTINNVESGRHPLHKTLYLALRHVLDLKITGMTWSLVQIYVDSPESFSPQYRELVFLKASELSDRIYRHLIKDIEVKEEWHNFMSNIDNIYCRKEKNNE